MTTLAANSPQQLALGIYSSVPVVADDIVYQGAMVGLSAGYGRPLTAGDKFVGHAVDIADNTDGLAGAKNIQIVSNRYKMIVDLAVSITDVGQPVYASDDAVLTLVAPSNSYVGVVSRYISSTQCEVEFRPGEVDEFGNNAARVTKSADYTTEATDCGKVIYVDTDAKTITLLAVAAGATAGYEVTIVNAAANGGALVTVDFNGSDLCAGGCGKAATADGVAIANTKATAKRGDFVKLVSNGGTGFHIVAMRGTWA